MAYSHGDLQEEFKDKRGQPFASDEVAYAAHLNRVTREENDQNLFGIQSGLRESLIKSGAAATAEAQESLINDAERKSKERSSDILLLALIKAGDADTFIAGQVFGNMTDDEIFSFAESVESETGLSVLEHARDILGDDMPEQKPGESEADYLRRAMEDVVKETHEDGEVKPEYADHALLRQIKKRDDYQAAVEFAKSKDAEIALNGGLVTEADVSETIAEAGKSHASSDTVAFEIEDQTLRWVSRDVQDSSRDEDVAVIDEAEDDFGMFGSEVSEKFNADFAEASSDISNDEPMSKLSINVSGPKVT